MVGLLLLTTPSIGQADVNQAGLRMGFNLTHLQGDFGVGLHVISPTISEAQLAFKLGANLHWFDQTFDATASWKPYGSVQLGFRTGHQMPDLNIYLYTEGGLTAILPNESFSSKNFNMGGYGLIGCEFSPNFMVDYFFEAGSMGSGARAEALPERVSYAHGFVMSVGIRHRL